MKKFDPCSGALGQLLSNQDPAQDEAKAKDAISKLDAFAGVLQPDGEFCFGKDISMADVYCVGVLWRMSVAIRHYRGFDIFSGEKGERVRKVLTAVRSTPTWQKTNPLTEDEVIYTQKPSAHARKMAEKPEKGKVFAG